MKEIMRFQSFTGSIYNSREEALNDECKFLRRQLELIAAQEEGLGGTATEAECWRSTKRIVSDTLLLIVNGERIARGI